MTVRPDESEGDSRAEAKGFLASPGPLSHKVRDDLGPSLIGQRIGPYEVLKCIAIGGMGGVYLAARVDDYKQRVAIKLIKRGMDTAEIVRRFRDERQMLASLKHASIARLLDGGEYDGLPYLVMEYIEGRPIDEYCDAQGLTTDERLALFLKVCDAVQHANSYFIIHRDIKPSNILVTGDGTPKLLDFGIAKLLNPELGFQALSPTHPGYRFLSPDYASPEQVRGDSPLGTSSDVYSLGVLLYELLTGHRPYWLAGRSDLPPKTGPGVMRVRGRGAARKRPEGAKRPPA